MTSTPPQSGVASMKELVEQEFIYHADQVDPNGTPVEKAEELSRTSIIMDVVKSLRTGKDLYRISLPAALLRPESMLEYMAGFLNPYDFVLEYVSSSSLSSLSNNTHLHTQSCR
jgi:hypothetical protein